MCTSGKALISRENQKFQKYAHRLSPVDDNCHIKYTNIHRYAARLSSLFFFKIVADLGGGALGASAPPAESMVKIS